jgi:hypothetical protein
VDVRLEEGDPNLFQPFLDILFRQLAVPLELPEYTVESAAQAIKHKRTNFTPN